MQHLWFLFHLGICIYYIQDNRNNSKCFEWTWWFQCDIRMTKTTERNIHHNYCKPCFITVYLISSSIRQCNCMCMLHPFTHLNHIGVNAMFIFSHFSQYTYGLVAYDDIHNKDVNIQSFSHDTLTTEVCIPYM